MNQHTPGPWQVNGSTIHGRDPVGERGEYTESPICTISHGWRNREIDVANARLIAAALEMLECLRHILDLADENAKGIDGYEQIAEWSRNLLAKVEGKE